jgi:hypothetical protein
VVVVAIFHRGPVAAVMAQLFRWLELPLPQTQVAAVGLDHGDFPSAKLVTLAAQVLSVSGGLNKERTCNTHLSTIV